MCPLCISALGWAAIGAASAGGVGALLFKRGRQGEGHDDSLNRQP